MRKAVRVERKALLLFWKKGKSFMYARSVEKGKEKNFFRQYQTTYRINWSFFNSHKTLKKFQ